MFDRPALGGGSSLSVAAARAGRGAGGPDEAEFSVAAVRESEQRFWGFSNHYGCWWIRACMPRNWLGSSLRSCAGRRPTTAQCGWARSAATVRPVFGCAATAARGSWCVPTGMRWRRPRTVNHWRDRCGRCTAAITRCVRVSQPGDLGLLHVVGGSQRDNMERMGRARRGGGRPVVRRGSWRAAVGPVGRVARCGARRL